MYNIVDDLPERDTMVPGWQSGERGGREGGGRDWRRDTSSPLNLYSGYAICTKRKRGSLMNGWVYVASYMYVAMYVAYTSTRSSPGLFRVGTVPPTLLFSHFLWCGVQNITKLQNFFDLWTRTDVYIYFMYYIHMYVWLVLFSFSHVLCVL